MSMYCGGHGHNLPCPTCAENLARRLERDAAHTPGQLYPDQKGNLWRRKPSELYQNGGGVAGDKPVAVASVGWHNEGDAVYPACENARRIAACWNACEGISTETLETESSAAMGWTRTASKLLRTTTQRDELLAALKALVAFHEAEHNEFSDAIDNARAAIAKAVQP